jgi:hypothetical protein
MAIRLVALRHNGAERWYRWNLCDCRSCFRSCSAALDYKMHMRWSFFLSCLTIAFPGGKRSYRREFFLVQWLLACTYQFPACCMHFTHHTIDAFCQLPSCPIQMLMNFAHEPMHSWGYSMLVLTV